MEDITPKLLEAIQKDFQQYFDKSTIILQLYQKVRDGTATYEEANAFAIETGEILTRAYADNISETVLPDGKMYYNIAQRILEPTMSHNYDLISEVTKQVQTILNKNAGIGIKAQVPDLNKDRISGLVNKISDADKYDDMAWLLKEPIINFSQSIVDDSIKVNADFQYNAGMTPKIKRTVVGNCCEWCREVEGIFTYPNVPKDVYRRHQRCRCVVEYHPINGKIQNVHTKKWRSEEEHDKIKIRKSIGISNSKITPQEREQSVIDKENRLLLLKKINDKEITLELNIEKQLPHMYATRTPGKSYFKIEIDELQQILYQCHGTGDIYVKSNGQIKEVITIDKNIGKHVDLDSGEETETNRMTVHYSKKRTHVVPARKEQQDG